MRVIQSQNVGQCNQRPDSFDLFQSSDRGIDFFRDLLDPLVVFGDAFIQRFDFSQQRIQSFPQLGLEIFRNLPRHLFSPAFWKSCAIGLGQPSGRIHQRRSRADQHRPCTDHGQMDLGLRAAMSHRTEQAGIDSG